MKDSSLFHFRALTSQLAALIAGIFLPFAFAPFHYFWLAIVSPALLLGLWVNTTPREAFLRGWWYGLGCFGVGVSWVYVSIHDYGNTPLVIAVVFTFLFVAFLALFPALQGYCLQWLFPGKCKSITLQGAKLSNGSCRLQATCAPNRSHKSLSSATRSAYGYVSKALLYFPATWTLMEWVRSWVLTGFPWLQLGHSQVSSPLAGFIPLAGIFGVTTLLVFLSGILYLIYTERFWIQKITLLLVLLAVFMLGTWLKSVQWTTAQANPLNISMVQGNIPQLLKWSKQELEHILQLYPALSRSIWSQSDLVIWPEAAVTLPVPWSLSYLNDMLKMMRPYPVSLITGIPVQAQNSWRYYNAMVLLGNHTVDIYYKRYLVPFGEYVPFETWLKGLVGFFALPMSDFIPGDNSLGVKLQNHQRFVIAPYICYEIAYPDAILTSVPGTNLMVVISNDTWFGNSLAPWQHLQIAQFAAISSGRYLLFSTNDGITAVVNPKGEVIAHAPRFQQAVLTSQVFLTDGDTPWVKWGHTYLLILLGLMIVLGKFLKK